MADVERTNDEPDDLPEIVNVAWETSGHPYDTAGEHTSSDSFLVWWGNTLGAAGVLMAWYLSASVELEGSFDVPVEELCQLWNLDADEFKEVLQLLDDWEIVRRVGSRLHVQRWLPTLTSEQHALVPRHLRDRF